IGLSHKIVIEDMFGLDYSKPARHMREYLEVLAPLLRGEPVDHRGEVYRVKASLSVPGAARVPLLVAALGPVMLGIAGRLSDGTITWMTGPRPLADHSAPSVGTATRAARRPEPRVWRADRAVPESGRGRGEGGQGVGDHRHAAVLSPDARSRGSRQPRRRRDRRRRGGAARTDRAPARRRRDGFRRGRHPR